MHLKESTKEFISGLTGAVASVCVCHPLDVARTMMNIMAQTSDQLRYRNLSETMRTIYIEEGWKGFYKGFRTTILSIPLFHCIYFPLYGHFKKSFLNEYGWSTLGSALGGAFIAGSITNVISNPLWVVRTRVMVQVLRPKHERYEKTFAVQVLRKIVQQQGYGALFKGLTASLWGMLHACVYFPIYENLKKAFNNDEKKLKSWQVLVSAIISKSCASIITYPHIVVRTIMHDNREDNDLKLRDVLKKIYHEKGLRGFYLGLKPDLIRVIPSNAIIFVVYELVKRNL